MDDTARVNQAFADLHDGLQLVKNVRSRVCDEPYLDMAINRLQKSTGHVS